MQGRSTSLATHLGGGGEAAPPELLLDADDVLADPLLLLLPLLPLLLLRLLLRALRWDGIQEPRKRAVLTQFCQSCPE